MSTDKLEKPKHNTSQQPTSQPGSNHTNPPSTNPPSAPCTGSLPRRNASGVFYRTPQDFVGGSQSSNLRRNCSMNDLQQKNQQDNQNSSWLPAPPPQVSSKHTQEKINNDDHDFVFFRSKRVSRFHPVWFEASSSLFFKDRFSSVQKYLFLDIKSPHQYSAPHVHAPPFQIFPARE